MTNKRKINEITKKSLRKRLKVKCIKKHVKNVPLSQSFEQEFEESASSLFNEFPLSQRIEETEAIGSGSSDNLEFAAESESEQNQNESLNTVTVTVTIKYTTSK